MVASHSRGTSRDSRRIHFRLVIIALVIVKGFKRYLARKTIPLKSKYYQLMMTIQQIETDNPLYQLETDLRNRIYYTHWGSSCLGNA
jgi:hypothetical protein